MIWLSLQIKLSSSYLFHVCNCNGYYKNWCWVKKWEWEGNRERERESTMREVEEIGELKLGGGFVSRAKASSQQQARESPGDDVREHVAFECSQHELHNSLVCKLHCPFHWTFTVRIGMEAAAAPTHNHNHKGLFPTDLSYLLFYWGVIIIISSWDLGTEQKISILSGPHCKT